MVASVHSASPPVVRVSPMVQRMGFGAVTFTVDDSLRMVAQGLLPEDSTVELLDGILVYRDRFDLKGGEIVPGVHHDYVVTLLAELGPSIKNESRHLRTEKTLVCEQRSAPIPDAFIAKGALRDYAERYPTAADVWCVIEVADSSYERDAGEKLIGYARAGVGQYIIINLRNRTAEVYSEPNEQAGTYAQQVVVAAEAELSLTVGDNEFFSFPLATLLP